MSISYDCARCGEHYDLHESLAGKAVRCKRCGGVSNVPWNAPVAQTTPYGYDLGAARGGGSQAVDDEIDGPTPWRAPAPRREKPVRRQRSGDATAIITALGVVGALVLVGMIAGFVAVIRRETRGPQPRLDAVHTPAPGARSKAHATLTNARAFRRTGPGVSFSLDYQFDEDGPRPGEMYVWVIEANNGKARQPLLPALRSGSLAGDVMTMQPENGPFSTYLAVQHGPSLQPISDAVSVPCSSDTAPVQETSPVPDPGTLHAQGPRLPFAPPLPPQVRPPGMPPFGPPNRPGFGSPPGRPPIRPPQMPPMGPRGPRGPRFRGGSQPF